MIRILLWGTQAEYIIFLNVTILKEVYQQIQVVGMISEEGRKGSYSGIRLYEKTELPQLSFDYLMCLNDGNYQEIGNEAAKYGVAKEKIISSAVLNLWKFDFVKYLEIQKRQITILANNCWGGLTYHALRKEFCSPFINMFEDEADYLKLLKNLKWYMEQPLVLEKMVYNENLRIYYPVYLLGDVRLYMNHYPDVKEAAQKWQERKARMDWNDLFVMMYTQSEQSLAEFDQLPFPHKVCFVPFRSELKSAYYISFYDQPAWRGREFWELVNWMSNGQSQYYDLLELLKT